MTDSKSATEKPASPEVEEETGVDDTPTPESMLQMELPGVYIDQVYSLFWKDHIRLMLGEKGLGDTRFWRFAAIMEKKDVIKLIKHLQSLLKDLNDFN